MFRIYIVATSLIILLLGSNTHATESSDLYFDSRILFPFPNGNGGGNEPPKLNFINPMKK